MNISLKEPLHINDNLHISIIYGRAGTGKSTLLSSMLSKCIQHNQSYVVLTATHSSLNNIYNISSNQCNVSRTNFYTIYAYFRIDYENNIILGISDDILPNYIFIDEFSLINKTIFKKILKDINKHITSSNSTNLVLFGDALQLNAIYTEKQKISFDKLKRINKLSPKANKYLSPNVIEHFHLSIFGLKHIMNNSSIKKQLLSTNYRNSSKITNTLNAIYKRDDKFNFKFVNLDDVLNLIINDKYIFLASKYKIIQHVYDLLAKRWDNTIEIIQKDITWKCGLLRLHLYAGAPLMIIQTSKTKKSNNEPEYYNGEYVTFTGNMECNNTQLKCINSNNEIIYVKQELDTSIPGLHKYFPVIPAQLISIHKSQGQSIDNIVVCIDELFDMSMLYTAITRSRNDVVFYTKEYGNKKIERLFEAAYIDDFKQLSAVINHLNDKNND